LEEEESVMILLEPGTRKTTLVNSTQRLPQGTRQTRLEGGMLGFEKVFRTRFSSRPRIFDRRQHSQP
jgi:hypothetical protein